MFNGKIHYFNAIFNGYVSLPEGKSPFGTPEPFLGLVDVGHLRHQTEIDQTQTAILQQHPAQGSRCFFGEKMGGIWWTTPQQTAWENEDDWTERTFYVFFAAKKRVLLCGVSSADFWFPCHSGPKRIAMKKWKAWPDSNIRLGLMKN